MIYVITGHLGSGKSLLAVELAFEYLRAGKRVASNLTLFPEHGMSPRSKMTPTKLPYIPTAQHLEEIGKGYDGPYNEDKFGLVLLDEAGSWLNSRDWADKDRRGLFTWITHARKHGWDVALIVQDFEALDAQIRRSVTEAYVKCSRADRIKIPFLPIKLPRFHVATARYQGPTGPIMRRWYTRGDDMFKAYDTREAIRPELLYTEDGPVDMRCLYTMLSAWHVRGRYMPPRAPWWSFLSRLFLATIIGLVSVFVVKRSTVAPIKKAAPVSKRPLGVLLPCPSHGPRLQLVTSRPDSVATKPLEAHCILCNIRISNRGHGARASGPPPGPPGGANKCARPESKPFVDAPHPRCSNARLQNACRR